MSEAVTNEYQLTPQPMSQSEFRALLDWYMCSDPWPVNDLGGKNSHDIVTAWLDRLAKADGWADWVDAYHRVPQVKESAPEIRCHHGYLPKRCVMPDCPHFVNADLVGRIR